MPEPTTTNVNVSSYSATRTAQRLSPPAEPRQAPRFLIFVIGILGLSILANIAELTPGATFAVGATGDHVDPTGLIFSVIGLAISVTVYRKRTRRFRAEYPSWEPMMALWQVAYYCAGCDHVSITARTVQGLAVGWSWHANNMRAGLLTAASKVDEYTRSLNRGRP